MAKIFLEPDSIKVMYELAGKKSLMDECLLRIMGNTGFRASDARTLLIFDVISDKGTIYTSIRKKMQKTGSYVERSLNESTRECLRKYILTVIGRSQYLFPGLDPRFPIGRTYVHELFKSMLRKIVPEGTDLKAASSHTLRRSVGFAISQKTNIETAAEFLGHRSIASTMSYLSKEKLKRQAESFLEEEMNF